MTDTTPADQFPTEIEGLPEASRPEAVRLDDGDRLRIEIAPVRKRIGGADVRMLAYNGSIPGPTLVVTEGSEVEVEVVNHGDVESTVHWHGLRLENSADGVPGETQDPIELGGSYTCRVQFPDPGAYWYHPHLREDFAQEMGLSGAIVVEPRDEGYWPPADRELTVTLDDVLIEDGQMVPFGRSGATFTAMGRFGNVMLINGEGALAESARVGEVVRLHLINTANTRIFNVGLSGARMKLVGGDSGRHEKEKFVDEVLLSPSERVRVDVLFDSAGQAGLEHRSPEKTYDLGGFRVEEGSGATEAAAAFEELRVDLELTELRASLAEHQEREPDKVVHLVSEMPLLYGNDDEEASSYECPMHPEVTSTQSGKCPKCRMKLVPASKAAASEDDGDHAGAHDHGHDSGDGLEWEDLMPDINRETDLTNMVWLLVDEETGAKNDEISWQFSVGDQVKIRLDNSQTQDHPMHHPFHIHGAGRFLVLSRDGKPEENFVWKDTVLIRADEAIDILLDVTNPGRWMAHCHIAEHIESNMMFLFDVTE
jgi:FtsP/CotA-like multicopper oxidase with cupredoxin domain